MTTLVDLLRPLSRRFADKRPRCPAWPPDAFAVAGYLLEHSGGYLRLLHDWPPATGEGCLEAPASEWHAEIRRVGRQWREDCINGRVPAVVTAWWQVLADAIEGGQSIDDARTEPLCCALLHLAIAADEASFGAGIVRGGSWMGTKDREIDMFHHLALFELVPSEEQGSTLCDEIEPTLVRVLPKLHTPQAGMTLRSLTHHLSLWLSSDVKPLWFTAPLRVDDMEHREPHGLNLLLLPWPDEVQPACFEGSEGSLHNMPDEHRLFTYRHRPSVDAAKLLDARIDAAFRDASLYCAGIDGVVLPELALSERDFSRIKKKILAKARFLIAGVGKAAADGKAGRNLVRFASMFDPTSPISVYQKKHHRWRIDSNQILQYQLGGQLDPEKTWWEHIEIEDRALVFASMERWITLCALVCEDLARQDPVSQLVRSVGPNLVITLLMDGPQLPARWPERYATVLADDPGSSVLTLTSLGMCTASRPPGMKGSRSVALWKDATSRVPVSIELPKDKHAILLNLVRHRRIEVTADGRRGEGASYPRLAGVHFLGAS